MRIALAASSYAPYVGGVEQHTARVAELLIQRGHDVVVWTVARDGRFRRREVDGVLVLDLPAPLPARNLGALLRFFRDFPTGLKHWRRAWKEFRPDVIHIQCFGPNGLYATGLSKVTDTPLIISSHGETDADDLDIFRTSFLIPAGLRHALRHANTVTGCSAAVADDLQKRFGAEGVRVVPNGVAEVPLGDIKKVPRRIVGVGRLEFNKGFDLLIRALAEVPDADLVLVGDGRERESLETLGHSLGLEHRIHFAGILSAVETRRTMAEAGVVVVPSRKESFGLVALEAWSVGTPLVATSICGPANFVTRGVDGLLVDPRDTECLAWAIADVLVDERLARRLVVAGQSAVLGFTWESVTNAYQEIYAASSGSER